MSNNKAYIVATIRPWNIKAFEEIISHYSGNWHLITKPDDLTKELIQKLNPRYIFFPHWSHYVSSEILKMTECVCFHPTDLPYGRGGSPIQNLIVRGHSETMISAIRMTKDYDVGPIYMKRPLSLEGLAEEIFIRASKVIAEMILEIITKEPAVKEQKGTPTVFKRRTPEQSEIPNDFKNLKELFDFIRMLDATEYPRAFIKYSDFKLEFSRPALRNDAIKADIHIKKINNNKTHKNNGTKT